MTEELNIENFTFSREDWTQYRSLERLCQRAGVTSEYILALVVKELVDNAWDASASDVTLERREDGAVVVADDGPGIDPDRIARMFSVNRPFESSKLWRLPTRGALGNGLRVVAGAVMALQGELTVITKGSKCRVIPNQETGKSLVLMEPTEFEPGTSVEINLPNLETKKDPFLWKGLPGSPNYKGRTNFHWYSPDNLSELFWAAEENMSVRQLVAQFEGATGPTAGVIAGEFLNKKAALLKPDEIERLLIKGKEETENINPKRLGFYGERDGFTSYYKEARLLMNIPMVIEIWGKPSNSDNVKFYFNRASTPCEVEAYREKKELTIVCNGYGRSVLFGSTRPLSLEVNITTPFIHSLNESKMPDLLRYVPWVSDGMVKVQKQIERRSPKPVAAKRPDIKSVVFTNLDKAIAHASGDGRYRYSLRQLFYAVRPDVEAGTGRELTYEYFTQLITEIEDGHDLPGIYRDSRGAVYHPHLRQEIPLGTMGVERYERPHYYFNKVLFIEKEGVITILKEAGWPEKWDCALMSSKGYASRAARDLIDLLAETSEPVQVFCAHDCDADGTMIYQNLCEATKARPERKIEIINLGLDVIEAQSMGLQVEELTKDRKSDRVADYCDSADADWLSHYRIELNAMTTPQLIEWLDRKMARQADEFKVVPPDYVVMKELEDEVKQRLRTKLEAEAWKAFGGERKLQATLRAALNSQDSSKTINSVTQFVHQIDRSAPWRDAINYLAADIVS